MADAVLGVCATMVNPIDTGLAGEQTIKPQMRITCDQNNNGNPQGERMKTTGMKRRGIHLYKVSEKASLRR